MTTRRTWLSISTVVVGFVVHQLVAGHQVVRAQRVEGAIAAEVNGDRITVEELDDILGQKLVTLEQEIYTLRRQKLDEWIIGKLMANEAMTRHISVDQLFEAEIGSKVAAVTDGDVAAFHAANKSRLGADEAGLREQIRSYLRNQRIEEQKTRFVKSLAAASNVSMRLVAPKAFRSTVNTDGAPVRGSSAAEVSIVEFSDFHCPYCRQAEATIDQLLQRYKGVVRVVYKHSPIDNLHPEARKAAEAAECAGDQDQFWQFHDELFRMTPAESTGVDNLMSIAARLHLRESEFQQCLQSGKHKAHVQRDVDEAAALGVTGTPTFFVNGRLMVGAQPFDSFATIIDEELAARGFSKLRTE